MNALLLKAVVITSIMCLPPTNLFARGEGGDPSKEEIVSPFEDMYAQFCDVQWTTATKAFSRQTEMVSRQTEIWLVDKARKNRKLLYVFKRAASISFSPDQNYITINDEYASNESKVVVFCHVTGLDYKRLNVDVTKNVWKYFCEQCGCEADGTATFDHCYTKAVEWSADSSLILLVLNGHDDSKNYVSNWYCVYDVKWHNVSLDLREFNRGAVKLE